MAISVATEAVLTVGLATPLIIEQVATRVSSLATRIGTSVTRLLTSFTSFSALFEALQELLRKGKTLFDRLPPGKAGVRALHAETPPSYTGAPLPSAPVKATGGTRPLLPDSLTHAPVKASRNFAHSGRNGDRDVPLGNGQVGRMRFSGSGSTGR